MLLDEDSNLWIVPSIQYQEKNVLVIVPVDEEFRSTVNYLQAYSSSYLRQVPGKTPRLSFRYENAYAARIYSKHRFDLKKSILRCMDVGSIYFVQGDSDVKTIKSIRKMHQSVPSTDGLRISVDERSNIRWSVFLQEDYDYVNYETYSHSCERFLEPFYKELA